VQSKTYGLRSVTGSTTCNTDALHSVTLQTNCLLVLFSRVGDRRLEQLIDAIINMVISILRTAQSAFCDILGLARSSAACHHCTNRSSRMIVHLFTSQNSHARYSRKRSIRNQKYGMHCTHATAKPSRGSSYVKHPVYVELA
jgi:hypothetical protein